MAHGPWAPERRPAVRPDRVLLDPYGRGVAVPAGYRAARAGVTRRHGHRDEERRDRHAPVRLGGRRAARPAVARDGHLRGARRGLHAPTRAPASRPSCAARTPASSSKIPYLVDLGITAVELLPVFQFDAQAAPGRTDELLGLPAGLVLRAARRLLEPAGPDRPRVDEFRDLVKALHRAGLEVILDVVYNHTAEGGADGPTLRFRGLANDDYYLLDPQDRSTLRRLQRHRQHVQGQRPDRPPADPRQPPLLGRGDARRRLPLRPRGGPVTRRGRPAAVGSADHLGDRDRPGPGRHEADRRGVGRRRALPGRQLRRATAGSSGTGASATTSAAYMRGEPGRIRDLTQRFLGSPDIYGHKHRDAQASINFVTCHDGFTLEDLVSYDRKHNEANGEGNRDGNDFNMSWNSGVEGPTDDPAIEAIRRRQVKNFLVVNMLSLGVPMLLMGDEVRRTQGGNNNAYCLDDPTGWFDWSGPERHPDILRFTKGLIRMRRRLATLLDVPDETNLLDLLANASLEWSGVTGRPARSRRVVAERGADAAGRTGRPARHLQRLLGAARLRAPRARRHARRMAPHRGHDPGRTGRPRPRRSPRRRRSRRRPTTPRRARSRSWPPDFRGTPRRRIRVDDRRGRTRADGRCRSSRRRLARGEPVVPVGPVSLRAGVGLGPRGLQRRRRRLELVPARPRAVPRLPLERGRDGRPVRRVRAAVPRPRAVERRRPDPQGADVRADQPGGQPRRGRQGLLVVSRRAPERCLAALALPLPAGPLPVRGSDRGERAPLQVRSRVRAARHRRLRRRPLLDRRGPLREGRPDRHPDADHRAQPGSGGSDPPRPPDPLVPQRVVLRSGHRQADDAGRRRRATDPRQARHPR